MLLVLGSLPAHAKAAEALLRARDPGVCAGGGQLYRTAWAHFLAVKSAAFTARPPKLSCY